MNETKQKSNRPQAAAADPALTWWVELGVRLNSERRPARLGKLIASEAKALLGAQRVLLLLDAADAPEIASANLPRGEDPAALLRAITPWLDQARDMRAAALRHGPEGADALNQRSCLVAPLVAQAELLGFLYADVEGKVGRFDAASRDRLALLAAQAGVALANARWTQGLATQAEQDARELADARHQQAAIGELLQVISRSGFDLETVLQTITERATRLCAADAGVMFRPDGHGNYPPSASHNMPPGFLAALQAQPIRPGDGSLSGRVLLEKRVLRMEDLHRAPGYRPDLASAASFHTMLSVPMLKDGEVVRVLTLARLGAVRAFTDQQVQLLTAFADQAVIAIENVRQIGRAHV